MATWIKAGFWETLCKNCKGYKGWLNLDQLIESKISGPVIDSQGNLIVGDSSNDTVEVGPGASHDIPNFSGMLLVNDHYNGSVELWLCGGGNTTVLVNSTPYGPGAGDVSINGGINGYTWTNTNDQIGPFTFTIIKTRNGA